MEVATADGEWVRVRQGPQKGSVSGMDESGRVERVAAGR